MAKKTDTGTYDELRARIKEGELSGAFVFCGEETYLRDRTLEQMRSALIPKGSEEFNLRTLNAPVSAEDVAHAVDSVPMLCDRTMVIVRDMDLFKLSEGAQGTVMSIIGEVPDYCTLIFVYDTLAYKPDGRKKISAVLKKHALTVDFSLRSNQTLIPWIRKHFRSGGKDMSAQDAEYLIFKAGQQMGVLHGEIEKLIAFAKKESVSREDIDSVVIPSLEAESFQLASTVSAGKGKEAFSLLEKLFALRQEPIALLGAMGWQFRRFYAAAITGAENGGAQLLMHRCPGMQPYSAKMTMQTAGSLPVGWCRRALILCAEADAELKSGASDDKKVMEQLLVGLLAERTLYAKNKAGHRS